MVVWEYFTVKRFILWPFGNFVVIWYFPLVSVYCVKKNLATLLCGVGSCLKMRTLHIKMRTPHF
jgi:hypothetical protein